MKFLLWASLLAIALIGPVHSANAAGVQMFVRHEVADYAVWRKAYDDFAPVQRKAGVTAKAAYRSVDNPNDITVIHDFANVEKAKAFAASPELKTAMEKAGVKGAPQIWYTTKADK